LESCFGAKTSQKFEDLWERNLALEKIRGILGKKSLAWEKHRGFSGEKKPRPGKNFFGPPQSQNPTSLPGTHV